MRDGESLGEYSWASLASGVEGRLLEDRGKLDQAAASYERAALLAVRGRVAPERAHALIRLARVRAVLGDGKASRSALAEARRVLVTSPQPGVLAHALAAAERGTALERPGGTERLSERELAVLRMLTSSMTQSELAAALYVSVNPLKTHLRTIYRKLGVSSREEAVARGRERGLL